jgi:hypothetical protein
MRNLFWVAAEFHSEGLSQGNENLLVTPDHAGFRIVDGQGSGWESTAQVQRRKPPPIRSFLFADLPEDLRKGCLWHADNAFPLIENGG